MSDENNDRHGREWGMAEGIIDDNCLVLFNSFALVLRNLIQKSKYFNDIFNY